MARKQRGPHSAASGVAQPAYLGIGGCIQSSRSGATDLSTHWSFKPLLVVSSLICKPMLTWCFKVWLSTLLPKKSHKFDSQARKSAAVLLSLLLSCARQARTAGNLDVLFQGTPPNFQHFLVIHHTAPS